MAMGVLDQVIDATLAADKGACTAGLEWADAHPGATVRQLAREAPTWACWYLVEALEMGALDAGRALLEIDGPGLSDADTARAVYRSWHEPEVVQVLSGLWGNDDARVTEALARAGWIRKRIVRAMAIAWSGDDMRLLRAIVGLQPTMTDAQLVEVLASAWSGHQLVVALSTLWLDENRVFLAMVAYGDFFGCVRDYIESAWRLWAQQERPAGLVRLADADPVPAEV